MSDAKTENDFRDSPVYWFVRLENAREREDHETVAEAICELRRLGVCVTYQPRKTPGGAAR